MSSARQALEGAALAPGNEATLRQLTDASRRPPQPREPLPPEVLNHVPPVAFDLDEDVFNRNLRSSKKGAAGGPSCMTCEHLRPLLPDVRGLHLLFQISERMARGQLPESTTSRAHGCCRCTALQHEQFTRSAQCQTPRLILPRPMQVCGDVCAPFCNSIRRSQTASVKLPQSRSRWEGLASAALRERVCLHFGRVGRIV